MLDISNANTLESLYYMEGDPNKRALLLPYLILNDHPGVLFFLDPWLDYPSGSYIPLEPDMCIDAQWINHDNIIETAVAASDWCPGIYPGMLMEVGNSLFLMACASDGSLEPLPIHRQLEPRYATTGCLWHQWWVLGSDTGEGYVLPSDIYWAQKNVARPFDEDSWKRR